MMPKKRNYNWSVRPRSLMLHHAFGVQVHGLHEGAHVLRVHVRVEAVAQVGDVAPRAEALQHLLHDVGNALLMETREGIRGRGGSVFT
ncbi:hypothetical protein EYF80_034048 [Liparis tanakae]|uniref:Uncharacterized protein n=1 Tax=Liparis tanakae TaxID=230148 RepID=A0A4Z2GPZ5_9TELE|nr:hypothetical protein EYF80_034048 [Liparis tanakae]